MNSHSHADYKHFTIDGVSIASANIAIESAVSLTVNGKLWLTFQCSPDDLEHLAVGFLFNEGFIHNMDEVESIHVCEKRDNVDIWLNHAAAKPETWRRTSGCHGGTTASDLQKDKIEPVPDRSRLTIHQIFNLIGSFLDNQPSHSESGGVHTSAFADGKNIIFFQEDIGRHNTFDKIAGRILMEKIEFQVPIILTTGRVSSDMMQKAVRIRTPFLISMRSTSAVSIDLAKKWGITLLSGARKTRVNVFSNDQRITL